MSMLRGVVVGHGDVARALIDAVGRIAGTEDSLVAVSNTDCDRAALEERITAAIGDGPGIVFIDMPSGSCLFAAMRRLQEMPGIRLVTGVNLAMLLEFVFHREGQVDEVAAQVAEAGARAVGTR
jgi:mannose/fructose-specific phosphotransferase system component IIA